MPSFEPIQYFALLTMSESVQLAIVTGIFGIIGTYLTVRYKDKVVNKSDKPKDRMETIFDGYEALIKQQQVEITRKGVVITSLEGVVDRLEKELATTRKLLNAARDELATATQHNRDLRTQLDEMKKEYNKSTHTPK